MVIFVVFIVLLNQMKFQFLNLIVLEFAFFELYSEIEESGFFDNFVLVTLKVTAMQTTSPGFEMLAQFL